MIIFVNEMLNQETKSKSVMEQVRPDPLALRPAHRRGTLAEARPRRTPWPTNPGPPTTSGSTQDALIEVPVQINGKLKAKLMVPPDIDEETMKQQALADEKVRPGRRRQIDPQGRRRQGPTGESGRRVRKW